MSERLFSSAFGPLVGGTPTSATEFLEVAILGRQLPGSISWRSTGVLIHPRVILGAAHCHQPPTLFIDRAGIPLQQASGLTPASTFHVLVNRVPLFDLALFVLAEGGVGIPVEPARRSAPSDLESMPCFQVVGFGGEPPVSMDIDLKREAPLCVDVLPSLGGAAATMGATLGIDPVREFSAKKVSVRICSGDSGAPAFVRVNSEWRLAGIASREVAGGSARPCGERTIFSRVDAAWPSIATLAKSMGVPGL